MRARHFIIASLALPLSLVWQFPAFAPLAEQSLPILPPNIILPERAEAAMQEIGEPVTLRIARIGVEAPIVAVGKTDEGKMDTPNSAVHAGWYKHRAIPGIEGTAVIGAHLEWDGGPGIFWRLHELEPGDVIDVQDVHGNWQQFRVLKRERYPVSEAPMDEIFNKKDGRFLNLITCAGRWRRDLGHYDERTVVYAEGVMANESFTGAVSAP